MRSFFGLGLLMFALPVIALEFQAFPQAHISEAQWQSYYGEVKRAFGGTVQVQDAQHLELYSDKAGKIDYVFTQKGHPAYPAWIASQPVQIKNLIKFRTIGFFAGSEPAFASLFRRYLTQNKQAAARLNDASQKEH